MKYIKWLVYSSKDPQKISLTIKGLLTAILTLVSVWAGIANIDIPNESLKKIIDAIVLSVQAVLFIVSMVATAYGAHRKVTTSSVV
jgi:hypothetical protein